MQTMNVVPDHPKPCCTDLFLPARISDGVKNLCHRLMGKGILNLEQLPYLHSLHLIHNPLCQPSTQDNLKRSTLTQFQEQEFTEYAELNESSFRVGHPRVP